MQLRNLIAASLFALLLLDAPIIVNSEATKTPTTGQAPTLRKTQTSTVAGAAVFAVSKYPDSISLDPIVIFNKGQYVDPQPDDTEASKQVVSKYMRAGQKHRLIFGGAEAGTVTIREAPTDYQIGLTAAVTLQSSIKLGGAVMALATSSATLGGKQNSRRAPTPQERAAMLDLMKETYKQKKVAASAIVKATVNNITAIDLDTDGKAELIGSFEISSQNQIMQNLLLIAEMRGGQYQSGLTWFKKGDEATSEAQQLIDVLDLDGDGVAEVFTLNSYYEGTAYTIYKKVNGVWRSVYHGGGFGV